MPVMSPVRTRARAELAALLRHHDENHPRVPELRRMLAEAAHAELRQRLAVAAVTEPVDLAEIASLGGLAARLSREAGRGDS